MSIDSAMAVLATTEKNPDAWTHDPATGTHTLDFGDLQIRVTKGRLNYGHEWALYNQGNIVLQGQYAETAQEAKGKAIAFAKKWMVDDIRI